MIANYINRYKNLLIAGILIPLFFCAPAIEKRTISIANSNHEPFMEIRDADSVTFFWNPPPWDPDTVKYYELLYRTISDTSWIVFRSNIPPSTKPEIALHRNEISSGDSIFYFAVRYISGDGISSAIHFSSDSTAFPPGGWFMFWKAK